MSDNGPAAQVGSWFGPYRLVRLLRQGGMRGVQRGGDLADDGDRPGRGQRPLPVQHRAQIDAVDQAHLHEQPPLDPALVVVRHHVPLGQPSGHVSLPLQPPPEFGVP
nr:hypothetical protein [Mycobacterium avium]